MHTADRLVADLISHTCPTVVCASEVERWQWASDASIYHLLPRVVVLPRHAQDVQEILRVAAAHRVPVCFRAGGTSLSGQAVTDGILVVVSRHLRGIIVHPGAEAVTCAPGAVGAWVNTALARHHRRIGPDPASMQAAQIGGIVANNASGMCCGVAENSYRTVSGLDLILADGYRLDTAATDADQRLARDRPDLAAGLVALRDEVRTDAPLTARIITAFSHKNTVGYSLNAFLDADSPAQILQRLVIGSEGTLAFIAAATLRTLPVAAERASAWLLLRGVDEACAAVASLSALGARAVELIDTRALASVAHRLPRPLPSGEPVALLCEFQAETKAALTAQLSAASTLLLECDLCAPAIITSDPDEQARLWTIRKGLFPSVAAVRKAGSAVIIEDVCFPTDRLAAGVRALRTCFATHGYHEAALFGHAKDGNLHFTITPDLGQPTEVARYDRFMRDLVDVVLALGGNLKAEHGTGRNMAPFVARQWGAPAVALMRRIKALLDPAGLLNPGVLLSDDPEAHIRHLKITPVIDPALDQCSECGFCEPGCPSRDLTYSPRQRITALRAIAHGGVDAPALRAAWQHYGLDTCAADGMCATACPAHIDTGAVVRVGRAQRTTAIQRRMAALIGDHLAVATALARGVLSFARAVGFKRLPGTTIPLPRPAPPLPRHWPVAEPGAPTLLYLPSCLARTMGDDAPALHLARLCRAAGVGLVVPEQATSLCCGQPFASKGFPATAASVVQRTITEVAAAVAAAATSNTPITGIITDTSSCAAQLERRDSPGPDLPPEVRRCWQDLTRINPAALCSTILIPRLRERGLIHAHAPTLVVHPTCSDQQHGWQEQLLATARAVSAGPATVPTAHGCCGMAGDKGWTLPALPAAATSREADAARQSGATCGISTSQPCAAALSAASGVPYRHLFAILAETLPPDTHLRTSNS